MSHIFCARVYRLKLHNGPDKLCTVFFNKFFSISQLNSHLYIFFFHLTSFKKLPPIFLSGTTYVRLSRQEIFQLFVVQSKVYRVQSIVFGLESRAGPFCEVTLRFLDAYFSVFKNYRYKSCTFLQIFEPALKTCNICSDCSKILQKFGIVHIQH